MKQTLGQFLKQRRDAADLTLRQVEEVTGVSNAYLSQLENDKIRKPSASVLYKLCKCYSTSLDEALYHAGLIEEHPVLKQFNDLTDSEKEQLIKYLNFLRSHHYKPITCKHYPPTDRRNHYPPNG